MIAQFKAFLFSCLASLAGIAEAVPPPVAQLRPPAVPLVTCDPYFSVWSFANRLTDDTTRHWTGASNALEGLVRIDGKAYRILRVEPKKILALSQVGLEVLPTRTIYKFEGQGVRITLTFATPLLASDLDVLSRPVTYLTWQVESTDNKQHAVSLYYDTSAELVVNKPEQSVVWSREKFGRLTALKMGSRQQPILAKSGDNLRIDWGYLYVAALAKVSVRQVISSAHSAQEQFVANGTLASTDDLRMPRAADDDRLVMAFAFDLGKVGAEPVSRHLLLAYDDLYSIEYFHHRLRPYWRR